MVSWDKRYRDYFDWLSVALIAILASIGLAAIFSATYTPNEHFSLFFRKQFIGVISGFAIYFFSSQLDTQRIIRAGYWSYFALLGLLFITLIKGSVGMGAQRWIDLGIIKFQPSELAKLFLPPFITYYLQNHDEDYEFKLTDFVPLLAIIGISFIVVLKQPDLGTALIIACSGAAMLWYAGLSKKFFLTGALIAALATPVLYKCLKPYQQQRINVFLGMGDSRKERYHIEQSMIAIGSGGITGKGFLQGTQNKLAFLPESRTDFIFAVICEEMGLLGASLVLVLLIALILRNLHRIYVLQNFYHQLLCLGLLTPIAFSIVVNCGMVIGLLPVVGIPLPLLSYGLTHLWSTFAMLGVINGVTTRNDF